MYNIFNFIRFFYKMSGKDCILPEIKEALNQGDTELAHRLVHTIKGVAGNIAATDVFASAEVLETATQHGKTDNIAPLLADFSQALDFVIDSLEVLEIEIEEGSGGSTAVQDEAVTLDTAKISSLLVELKGLLEEDFTEAESRLESLKKLLASSKVSAEFKKLETQISEYDFDSANTTIDALAIMLGISLEGAR